jgi:hypothetical protein
VLLNLAVAVRPAAETPGRRKKERKEKVVLFLASFLFFYSL